METLAQSSLASQPIEHSFNPYDDNGGTIVGIAGKDFALLAGDTRQSTGYSITSRRAPKVTKVGDNILMGAIGFAADGDALVDNVQTQIKWYHHSHNKDLKVQSCARMIQQILYRKRFFPFYVYTTIAGIDDEGKGAIYSYDPVGSYERERGRAGGAAASLITPFLDNQVNKKNQYDVQSGKPIVATDMELDEAIQLVRDAFDSATERHIQVGDGLQIAIVTKHGIREEFYDLKRD
jgi:20S proteasome subunit beta 6